MSSKLNDYIINLFLIVSLIFIPLGIIYPTQYSQTPIGDPFFIVVNIIGSFSIIVVIEFIIMYLFFKSADLIKKDLLVSVLLVNNVVFLPTFTIAYLILAFNIIFFPSYVLAIFIMMLGIEYLFYRLEFHKLQEKKSINTEISTKKTIIITMLANLCSGLLTHVYPSIVLLLEFAKWPELYF